MIAEQALTSAFFAVINLHHTARRLLVFVAVFQMHIIVNQLNAGKDVIQSNRALTALIFQQKCGAFIVFLTPVLHGAAIQFNTVESPFRCRPFQNIFCKLVWIFHTQFSCFSLSSIQTVPYVFCRVKKHFYHMDIKNRRHAPVFLRLHASSSLSIL